MFLLTKRRSRKKAPSKIFKCRKIQFINHSGVDLSLAISIFKQMLLVIYLFYKSFNHGYVLLVCIMFSCLFPAKALRIFMLQYLSFPCFSAVDGKRWSFSTVQHKASLTHFTESPKSVIPSAFVSLHNEAHLPALCVFFIWWQSAQYYSKLS